MQDTVQTRVPISSDVGMPPASSSAVGSLCFDEGKARDFEKSDGSCCDVDCLTMKTQQCARSRSDRNLLAGGFNKRSMLLGLSTGLAAELQIGWSLETKSRRDKCSSELRIARTKDLIANPPFPLFLKLQNRNDGSSIPLESGESKVITTRLHLMFAVRGCFERMHRGDHFILIERPTCRWYLLSGESGFARTVSWLWGWPRQNCGG